MAIQVGDRFPEAKVQIATQDGIENSTTADLLGGKKIVLFAVPGAFTPTCSAKHLPSFIDRADEITGKGVDAILCLSVNDAFVLEAWAKDRGAGSKVTMIADGSAEITKALGLEMDASRFGMGLRCQRFAAVIDDGVVTALHVEEPMKFEVSSAEAILAVL